MRNTNIRKTFSAIFAVFYLMFYTASAGLCIANTPAMTAAVHKPVLRTSTSVSSASTGALKLEGDIALTKSNQKINLSLRDSDVKQVLRMFADKAGLNIIFHSSVTDQTVTLDMVNTSLNDAFKLILQVANLTYYIDKNTMVVMSSDAAKSLNLAKQEMTVIPVKYVSASVLAAFLNNNIFSLNKPGLSNAQIVVTNPSKNELLVFGTNNDYLMAKKIVNKFDVKPLERTFIVNHTTPDKMADLLCNVLFKDEATAPTLNNSSSSSSGSAGNAPATPATQPKAPQASPSSSTSTPTSSTKPPSTNPTSGSATGGAASILDSFKKGQMTGAASDSGSSSSALNIGAGVIACQYNNPISTSALSSLSENSLTITYFAGRGTINVMGGSEQQMQMIKDFIDQNDKKQPQAYLEISIIELTNTGTKEFDNTWQLWSSIFSGSFSGSSGLTTNTVNPTFLGGDSYGVANANASSSSSSSSSTNPSAISYYISKYTGTPVLTYAISYIITNAKGRILANPRIMITNGEASTIDLSSDYVKKVTSQVLEGSSSITSATTKQYDIGTDEGIKVSMTPFISPAGYVTLNITPKYSTVKEKIYTTGSDGTSQDLAVTLLQRRNLELKNVRIKDGETLVIGGMIREDEAKTTTKMPVLGDLPGAGMFFRNTSTTKEKSELVIMITPKIIKDSEDVVNNNNPGTDL